MEEIIKTTLLVHERSTFLIDLVKHNNEKLYIRIQQTIRADEKEPIKEEIKINPSNLNEIVEVLTAYRDLIPEQQFNHRHLTKENMTEIQNRYLKGISIRDLTVQFDCSAELIEIVLINRGIKIVANEPPKKTKFNGFKRRK